MNVDAKIYACTSHFLIQTMTINLVNWSMEEDQLEIARKDL